MDSDQQFRIAAGEDAQFVLDLPTRDTYRVALRAADITASIQVHHIGSDFLGVFFEGLARDWHGWDGVRRWHSLEHQLVLEATHGTTGAVGLRVILRDSSYDAWQVRYDLGIENGDLDRLARDGVAFSRHLGAAP